MKFQVRRTSGLYHDVAPPCEGAVKAKIPYWDRRTFKSEAEADRKFGRGWWRSEGTDHRRSFSGGIERRKADEDRWAIEVDSLDGLMKLIEQEGEVVISPPEAEGSLACIEIYDGYRE